MKTKGLKGGFAVSTISEEEIKSKAKEKGITLSDKDWESINADCYQIEKSVQSYLNKMGIETRDEGHDSEDVLVGTFWCKQFNKSGIKIIAYHDSQANPLVFSDHSNDFLENCSEIGKKILDGYFYFFNVEYFSE